jgi:hypothetical protein
LNQPVLANYTAPCNGTIGVIVLPCDDNGQVIAQITMAAASVASVPIPCVCEVSLVLNSSDYQEHLGDP